MQTQMTPDGDMMGASGLFAEELKRSRLVSARTSSSGLMAAARGS
ncbi:hypothetical protein GQ55_2G326300 [Panicum hallii var. hallii]|uniref:Uncharacterized protein n=1 Tax=Panicum hallii var. hallii TaxID=1504633 RepID=A0A2T7EUU3_9POAL|nr:hypothetical protein GQ55_2G326300 [Panicum hallii var. hallii]